jgi:CXXC-20-CXXC protein
MLPKCPKCENPVSLSWILSSLHQTKYACPNCGTILKWNTRRRIVSSFGGIGVIVYSLLSYFNLTTWFSILVVFACLMTAVVFVPKQFSTFKNENEQQETKND